LTETVIEVRGLGKRYRVGERERYLALRDILARALRGPFRLGRKAARDTIWALLDVSLDIAQGEVIDLIGHNGASKTTLLKILSRITRPATIFASTATAAFILWNLGLIFQWGTHLIPARGPISWRDAAYNQVSAVPEQAAQNVKNYLTGRKQFLNRVEEEDVKRLKPGQHGGTK